MPDTTIGTNSLVGVIVTLWGTLIGLAKLSWDSVNKKHATMELRMCDYNIALQTANLNNAATRYSNMVKMQTRLVSESTPPGTVLEIKDAISDCTVQMGLLVEEQRKILKVLEETRNAKQAVQ